MWIKKAICKHDYQLVSEYRADVDSGVAYDAREFKVLYCPKCKKEIEVLEHDYRKIIGIQEIDKQYRQQN